MNLRFYHKNEIKSSRKSLKYRLTRLKSYQVLRILYYLLKHELLETQIFIATYSNHRPIIFMKTIHPREHSMALGPQN